MNSVPKLFFLYAHPCGDVLVRRGKVRKEELAELRNMLRCGSVSKLNPLIFSKAITQLEEYAKRKRGKITRKLVHEYFTTQHNAYVLEVAKKRRDVKPERCFISPAVVIGISGKNARVLTPFGYRNIINEFVPNLKIGDLVSTHYNYACEKISFDGFKRLWREVEGYEREK